MHSEAGSEGVGLRGASEGRVFGEQRAAEAVRSEAGPVSVGFWQQGSAIRFTF